MKISRKFRKAIDAINLAEFDSSVFGEVEDGEVTLDVELTNDEKKLVHLLKVQLNAWQVAEQAVSDQRKKVSKSFSGPPAEAEKICDECNRLIEERDRLHMEFNAVFDEYHRVMKRRFPMIYSVVTEIRVRARYVVTYVAERSLSKRQQVNLITRAVLTPVVS